MRWHWPGARADDRRYKAWFRVPEFPWPIRGDYVCVEEADGRRRWECIGLNPDFTLSPDAAEALDSDDYALTVERNSQLRENFLRYSAIGEQLLLPTKERIEEANRVHAMMRKKKGGRWTRAELAILAADYSAYSAAPDTMLELEALYGIVRSNLWRQLQRCEREGLIAPGVLQHRRRARPGPADTTNHAPPSTS